MDDIMLGFQQLSRINEKNNHSTQEITLQSLAMQNQKVTVPIIGKFSTGKSALINALLGYSTPILREDITPETAVPTEISYSDSGDGVTANTSGETKPYSIKEYMGEKFYFDEVKSVSIKLDNNFLEQIKDVMLVDMPGYDSGYDVHNKAIDYYLPRSLAYIITFSAEDMTLKYNMISTLIELMVHDMPICIVITKHDKVTDDVLQDNLANLKSDLLKHLEKNNFHYCITSSHSGDVDELRNFLVFIQEQSQEIISKKYKTVLSKLANDTNVYLTTILQKQNFTVSELSEKEVELGKELEQIKESLAVESGAFQRMIPECIKRIKNDILCALNAEESTFVSMLMNTQDISERVNNIVRVTVTESIKKHFVPKVQKHIENVTERIHTLVSADVGILNNKLDINTDNIVKTVANTSVAAISLIIFGPLLTLIGGLIAWFVGNKQKEKENQKQRHTILQKLHGDVFPNVVSQVSMQLEIELNKNATEINKVIVDELNSQYATVSDALNEVIKQKEDETTQKERIIEELSNDIEVVKEIIYECK